ncbi:Phosphoenolpyruvate-protein phosphotransferase of PTS system [hydrothermal vent metagenome]|uniref:phosphoenolpyruvate--protein phosphotransferase n=1 Tax=hydrothermal vent metagenome TaxID=652676 RepID=A0A1W1BFV9_9ZZZZ
MNEIIIKAPIDGIVFPIEEVPDEVFAQKMIGDGISIDPSSSRLYAPIDGTIIQLHKALHAITIKHNSSLEVMIHIGLDSVKLKSQGFNSLVSEGDEVKAGELLITFDLEYVERHAKSLLTQIVLTNMDIVDSIEKSDGEAISNETTLMRVRISDSEADDIVVHSSSEVSSDIITILSPTGLHARPSGVLASIAKMFSSTITLHKGEDSADLKSSISIMSLNVEYQDRVLLKAIGDDAEDAIDILTAELQREFEAEDDHIIDTDTPSNAIVASDGIAIGEAYQVGSVEFDYDEYSEDIAQEISRLKDAIRRAESQIEREKSALTASQQEIYTAHQEILKDSRLLSLAIESIESKKSAEYGWHYAYDRVSKEISSLPNELLRDRAIDILDVGGRVMKVLMGDTTEIVLPSKKVILLANEITPSLLSSLPKDSILGFCSVVGGSTSHISIIARSLGIPALVGVDSSIVDIESGTQLILDAEVGELIVEPSKEAIDSALARQKEIEMERSDDLDRSSQPATTLDGREIEILANIAKGEEAIDILSHGGDGVGLFRTEYIFMDRDIAPTEDEQYEIYRDVALALHKRPIIIRTLDVGGDKPISYLSLPKEENPFLGMRGVRVGLENLELLKIQIRAILRASEHGEISIMFPMVSTIDEFRELKAIVEEERSRLSVDYIPIGIMVEVPSVAILADIFAKEVDFFSIGTNDLTQYTLAMDRGNAKLSKKADALDPSLLRLIKMTIDAARNEGIKVGVCGALASNPLATSLLVGMGIDELSLPISMVPHIKAKVRERSYTESKLLADEVLNADTTQEVYSILSKES